jgi:hypothetical protein
MLLVLLSLRSRFFSVGGILSGAEEACSDVLSSRELSSAVFGVISVSVCSVVNAASWRPSASNSMETSVGMLVETSGATESAAVSGPDTNVLIADIWIYVYYIDTPMFEVEAGPVSAGG